MIKFPIINKKNVNEEEVISNSKKFQFLNKKSNKIFNYNPKKQKINFQILKNSKYKNKKKIEELFNWIEQAEKIENNNNNNKKLNSFKNKKYITINTRLKNINHPYNQFKLDTKILKFQSCYFTNKDKKRRYFYDKMKKGKLIGKGSFGEVFKFLNLNNNKVYAGKLSNKNNSIKNNLTMEKEFEIIKTLNDENVINYEGKFYYMNNLVFLMEYHSCGSLFDFINKNSNIDINIIKFILKEILKGISYIHEKNIIHRDLKSSNILISKDGKVIISDFGSSCIKNNNFHQSYSMLDISDISNDNINSIKGSFYWMAPEILKGKYYGRKSDIWSFGCIILELITRKHPWYLINNLDMLLKEINDYSSPYIPVNIDSKLLNILKKCWNYDVKLRPSAKELLKENFFKKNKLFNLFSNN